MPAATEQSPQPSAASRLASSLEKTSTSIDKLVEAMDKLETRLGAVERAQKLQTSAFLAITEVGEPGAS